MAERRYGILIASSQFPKEPKLENLQCPENDVDALNKILTSKAHGEFIKTFTLKNAPHHKVQLMVNQVLRKASKDDLVLIYYSGHGKLNPAGRLHLACTNTIVSALEATSIPVSMIKEYADISPSNKVVLILDCCFAGAAGPEFTKGSLDDQLQLISGGRGTYIMTASTGIQVAVEKESDQYGVFTKHIIEGISKGDADTDGDGLVTMDELYSYVHDRVLEEGFQEPMKWDLNVRGNLVIARSGKIPGEKRRKQIREILFDLAKKGMIADDILDKAREVIALDPTELSGELRAYDDLLEQLLQKRLEPVDFIRKWDKIGGKPSPQKGEPATPGPPPPGPVKPEPRPREPKITEPRKMSRTLKFGALAGVAVLLLIVGWWYISQPEKEYTNSIGIKFVLIPAGSFKMGSAISPSDVVKRYGGEEEYYRNEHPQHKVTISKPFYMQATELTQGQWYEVMGTRPWSGKEYVRDNPDCPAVYISWDDCQSFIRRLNQKEDTIKYRLPTEAEWEYACRAGSTTTFHFGKSDSILGDYAWYRNNAWDVGEKYAHTVAQKQPNFWGLYDTHGNVWEWCQDWYVKNYPTGHVTDPKGPSSDTRRVFRGGGWSDLARYCRSAYRSWRLPDYRSYGFGFRVARAF